MPVKALVDTSVWFALVCDSDQQHDRAAALFRELRVQDITFLHTSFVYCETVALIERRLGNRALARWRDHAAASTKLILVDATMIAEAWRLRDSWKTNKPSLVDCTVIVAARMINADAVLAFDRHFKKMNWKKRRDGLWLVSPK